MLKEKMHVAVTTAFNEDESLDTVKTVQHIKRLYSKGVKSVLISGTTGEQHSMSLEEKIALLDAINVEEDLIGKMEIIMGVSSVRQKEAEKLAKEISESNISGIMLGFPPYIQPTQKEAIQYSERIIELSNKPVILYNNPGRTGFDLSSDSIIYLSKSDSVIGIKDPGDQKKVVYLKKEIKKDFQFYAGGENDLEKKVSWGYNRLSSIAGNIYPDEVKEWFDKLLNKDTGSDAGVEVWDNIKYHIYEGNPILNIKNILSEEYDETWLCRSPIGNAEN
ncbi:dihydrodipicolinate synthase family protein [Lacicoccus qingdaonensis]|uniref:4-hydroxy-tetrahydrodipicolinate synthase n=1 Tax=Lacicoccus qingdaonensis TaxID=576118 RepID=A0A1G9G4Z1_9BACL|nr:dihydrodipicolinate synthase family protein [Salinicoccus qingdaonensis]SDK95739.1 4-hydroxy-tetrahydrodipicolinate synthase [Salinicoccus qingdaonensis]